ncbi:MAG: TIGR02281 family clan AA aspartic protease [Aestuariivita sp.]|nr:TIGR02281 family clan AA aspartic protease [Aestuariivita sp.]
MNEHQIGNLIYLSLLGIAVIAWFVLYNRESLNRTLQQALIWGLIFFGVVMAFGLWDDFQEHVAHPHIQIHDSDQVAIPRSIDGHYYITVQINEEPVNFLIDTGATNIVLSREDASRVGISVDRLVFRDWALTANGQVKLAPVQLDRVALGPIEYTDVSASVSEGPLFQSLLGMDYLQLWERIEITQDQLILTYATEF